MVSSPSHVICSRTWWHRRRPRWDLRALAEMLKGNGWCSRCPGWVIRTKRGSFHVALEGALAKLAPVGTPYLWLHVLGCPGTLPIATLQALVALRRPHLIFQLQNINFKQTDSQELKLFNQSSNSYLCLPCCSLSGNFHPLCHLSISSSPVEIIAKGLRSLHTRALAHRKSKPNRDVSKRPFLDGAGTPRVACFMKIFHKTVIIRYF